MCLFFVCLFYCTTEKSIFFFLFLSPVGGGWGRFCNMQDIGLYMMMDAMNANNLT